MVKEKPLTVEQKIVRHLFENGQKYTWLASKLGLSLGHLRLILKGEGNQKRELTEENRQKINELLGTNF